MDLYKRIVSRFPLGSVSYMFAYGSGVKQQAGYEKVAQQKNNIIDLMFCVRDAAGFHAENIYRHPSHYSSMRYLGPEFVANYQERYGANVYFNTLVPLDDVGVTVKYGVVSEHHLLEDLRDWRHLYLAGRLHKPVQNLSDPSANEVLSNALRDNLVAALRTALLILPARFLSYRLYQTIANLSYAGDFRMIFGENKKKVTNIVEAQHNDFYALYEPAMKTLADYVAIMQLEVTKTFVTPTKILEQDKSDEATAHHLRRLPSALCQQLLKNSACRGEYAEAVQELAVNDYLPGMVQAAANDIVRRSSLTQTLKNIPSAGVAKSVEYGYRKAAKTFAN